MTSRTPDETAALAAAKAGDKVAFGALVRLYQRQAYHAAYSFAGNSEDAVELAQEAFIRAYRAMDRFDISKPFYPWLYRIIKNTCLNHIKRRNRRAETSLDHLMEVGYDAPDENPCPTDKLALDDTRRNLQAAMAQLTPEQREIIRLRHFLELSYAEIAECLDVPKGTVMSRLHGARKSLRTALESNISTTPTV